MKGITLLPNFKHRFMFSSEDLEYFRLIMSIASLLELCHSEKIYVIVNKYVKI